MSFWDLYEWMLSFPSQTICSLRDDRGKNNNLEPRYQWHMKGHRWGARRSLSLWLIQYAYSTDNWSDGRFWPLQVAPSCCCSSNTYEVPDDSRYMLLTLFSLSLFGLNNFTSSIPISPKQRLHIRPCGVLRCLDFITNRECETLCVTLVIHWAEGKRVLQGATHHLQMICMFLFI